MKLYGRNAMRWKIYQDVKGTGMERFRHMRLWMHVNLVQDEWNQVLYTSRYDEKIV